MGVKEERREGKSKCVFKLITPRSMEEMDLDPIRDFVATHVE